MSKLVLPFAEEDEDEEESNKENIPMQIAHTAEEHIIDSGPITLEGERQAGGIDDADEEEGHADYNAPNENEESYLADEENRIYSPTVLNDFPRLSSRHSELRSSGNHLNVSFKSDK